MLNKVTLIGNLGQDPEIRYMPSGSAVCNFSVATAKRWKDKQTGEQKEHTEWHKCAAFGKLAEICDQWLRKGKQVYIEGELRTRKWEKDGQNHYSTEIVVDEMKMLGPKPEGGAPNPNRRQPPGDAKNQDGMPPHGSGGPGPDDFDDDIPF